MSLRGSQVLRALYTGVLYLLVPVILTRLWWRGRKAPQYRKRIAERFGRFTPPQQPGGIWIHAVSVGEALSAVPLVRALKQKYPDGPITMTTMTPTGSERVQAALGERVFHVYVPYDIPLAIKGFLSRIQPDACIIMETELWPNIISMCQNRHIPLYLVNARLSNNSMRGYSKIKPLIKPLVQAFEVICTQTAEDAYRYQHIGANPAQIQVTGNLKFELSLPERLTERAEALRQSWGTDRPVWVAASTHRGEDEQVLAAFSAIKKRLPNTLLVLVPRHPERFDDVFNQCSLEYTTSRRSEHSQVLTQTDVLLGDTMGELLLFYRAADVAFIGGSLVETGGHNPLEAAVCHTAIVTGPYTHNFKEMMQQFESRQGLWRVQDSQTLAEAVITLLEEPEKRHDLTNAAYQIYVSNQGALQKTLVAIRK